MDLRWKSIAILETHSGLVYNLNPKFTEKIGLLSVLHQIQIVNQIENYIDGDYYPIEKVVTKRLGGVSKGLPPIFLEVTIWVGDIIKVKNLRIIDSDNYLDMYIKDQIL